MPSAQDILHTLDHANDGYYCDFIPLNHPYSCLIDTRLNLFRSDEEWAGHHQDFTAVAPQRMSADDIRRTYDSNASPSRLLNMSLEELTAAIRAQEERTQQYAQLEWTTSRPSSYETWQQLAQVLATGETQWYQPTLSPNTHWSNWPEAGSL